MNPKTIPPKVVKSLFLREIDRKIFIASAPCRTEPGTRRCRPPEGGRQRFNFQIVLRKAGEAPALEDASEEAGAAAEQPPRTPPRTPVPTAAAEAALAADVRCAGDVGHRVSDVQPAANQLVASGAEAPDDVTELVVTGQDATLVAEDPAFAVEQPADQTVEQPSVNRVQKPAEQRETEAPRIGGRRNRASPLRGTDRAPPRLHLPFVPLMPMQFPLPSPAPRRLPTAAYPAGRSLNSGLPLPGLRHGADGGKSKVSPHDNSTKSGLTPLSARIRKESPLYVRTAGHQRDGLRFLSHCTCVALHCTALHRLGTVPASGMSATWFVVPYRPPSRPVILVVPSTGKRRREGQRRRRRAGH